jgi:16S rRNA (guanine966-N2)-methyltransferase
MRVIAGRLKGRALATPRDQAIRPTSDRLRETIFNVLAHGLGKHGIDDPVSDAIVLDLFAGTGALAIEALSRGAANAVMVDIGHEARGLQRENVEAMGLGGVTRILRRDATKLGAVQPFAPFSLAFLDPPYGKGLGEAALASAVAGGWLAEEAIVVLEERAGLSLTLPPALAVLDTRVAGEGQVLIARYSAAGGVA